MKPLRITHYDRHHLNGCLAFVPVLLCIVHHSMFWQNISYYILNIARHHRSKFAYGSSPLVYGYYIARPSVILYYHSLFSSLGHGATIVMSYSTIVMSDTMVAPEWHFCQIISYVLPGCKLYNSIFHSLVPQSEKKTLFVKTIISKIQRNLTYQPIRRSILSRSGGQLPFCFSASTGNRTWVACMDWICLDYQTTLLCSWHTARPTLAYPKMAWK